MSDQENKPLAEEGSTQASAQNHEAPANQSIREPRSSPEKDTSQALSESVSFADMLESSSEVTGRLNIGEKVTGAIVSITDTQVFVDTGAKMEGIVERQELLDKDGNLPYAVGDEIELYVVAVESGAATLSRALQGEGGLELLQDAYSNNVPLEGKVQSVVKGGYQVEVMKRRAFCPASQMDIHFVEDQESFIGETLRFKIIKLEEGGRNIVLSRRQLLEEEQKESAQEFLQGLAVGQILQGRVVRLMPFGAFIELAPGVEGMAHVSELGWSRVESPEEAVSDGQEVTVKVLEMKPEKKTGSNSGQMRISLSLKQAMADPWTTAGEQFTVGEVVGGKVTRLAKFGAFVEVAPGLEGLIHLSEMSYARRVNKAEEIVEPGQEVQVKIKELDLERRRIGLSLRDAEGDPWSDVEENFPRGSTVVGKLEKRADFGLFINLAPGVTGLMPKSRVSRAKDPAALEHAKPGEDIQVVIEEINFAGRKMTLAPAEAAEQEHHGDWKSFAKDTATPTMSLLGEKLQAALKKKK